MRPRSIIIGLLFFSFQVGNGFADTTSRITSGVLAISRDPANRLAPIAAPGETFTTFSLYPETRVTLQIPADGDAESTATETQTPHIIVYLLPNGSTREQALGRSAGDGVGWKYWIQHIAAQTRCVRELLAPRPVITAVLEAETLSWPEWRRETSGSAGQVVDEVIRMAVRDADSPPAATFDLVAHSGGGSFIWDYLNGHKVLPDDLEHIALLDANYSYSDDEGHGDKLVEWLQASDSHRLIVLAYDDTRVTIDGKPIVSETGGTWRATDRMARRLEQDFEFTGGHLNDLQTSTALDGRIVLARHPNPENKILHTVLVERNGFVYSAVEGRAALSHNDVPFSEAETYRKFILP